MNKTTGKPIKFGDSIISYIHEQGISIDRHEVVRHFSIKGGIIHRTIISNHLRETTH
jgi:hypothetical protein